MLYFFEEIAHGLVQIFCKIGNFQRNKQSLHFFFAALFSSSLLVSSVSSTKGVRFFPHVLSVELLLC
jgi:hypothetical protein